VNDRIATVLPMEMKQKKHPHFLLHTSAPFEQGYLNYRRSLSASDTPFIKKYGVFVLISFWHTANRIENE